jgi:hypothetical protein
MHYSYNNITQKLVAKIPVGIFRIENIYIDVRFFLFSVNQQSLALAIQANSITNVIRNTYLKL